MKSWILRIPMFIAALALLAAAILLQFGGPIAISEVAINSNALFLAALAVFALSATFHFSSTEHQARRVGAYLKTMEDLAHHSSMIQVYSFSFEDSFDYLAHKLNTSKYVYSVCNTIIGPVKNMKVLNYASFEKAKKKCIEGGTHWRDLITPGSGARMIPLLQHGRTPPLNWHVSVLRENASDHVEFLNFMTFRGADSLGIEYHEVVLGWERKPAAPASDDEVLVLAERRVVERYEKSFNNLWEAHSDTLVQGGVGVDPEVARAVIVYLAEAGKLEDLKEQTCPRCKNHGLWGFIDFGGRSIVFCKQFPMSCEYVS